jgi:hypothetical protein
MNASESLVEKRTDSPQWELAQRVVASAQLKSSPKLCEFFLYVVDCGLRNAPEEATEQQIGIHVFHREPGYNSSDDSIVRSQARLLRLKLAAYFAEEGAHEEFFVEIPKGHYLPVFHPAKTAAALLPVEPLKYEDREPQAIPSEQAPPAREISFRHRHGLLWRYLAVALACIVMGGLLGVGWSRTTARSPAVDLFWKPFLSGDPPLVIYSNPLFTGTPYSGMRLVLPSSSTSAGNSPDIVDDTYTGTGEAVAIHELTRLFDMHHAELVLKRSRLVTWDEAKSRNLIFVGAASQNSALQDLKANSDFMIDLNDDHQGYIANRHPRLNEPAKFVPSSPNDEYAIVASFPGIEPGTRIVMFTGLTTNGTQAAVEFMCDPRTAEQLTKTLGRAGGGLVPFEAVLHIKMSGGVPLHADVAAVHTHT